MRGPAKHHWGVSGNDVELTRPTPLHCASSGGGNGNSGVGDGGGGGGGEGGGRSISVAVLHLPPPSPCDSSNGSILIVAATSTTIAAPREPPPSRRLLSGSTCYRGAADSSLRRWSHFSAGVRHLLVVMLATQMDMTTALAKTGSAAVRVPAVDDASVDHSLIDAAALVAVRSGRGVLKGGGSPHAGPAITALVETVATAPSAPRLMPLARRPRPCPPLPTCRPVLRGQAGARSCSGCPCHHGGLRGAYPTLHIAAARGCGRRRRGARPPGQQGGGGRGHRRYHSGTRVVHRRER